MDKFDITEKDFTQEELSNVDILGSMLYSPRWKKAEILFGDSGDKNIAKVDFLQSKYFPVY